MLTPQHVVPLLQVRGMLLLLLKRVMRLSHASAQSERSQIVLALHFSVLQHAPTLQHCRIELYMQVYCVPLHQLLKQQGGSVLPATAAACFS